MCVHAVAKSVNALKRIVGAEDQVSDRFSELLLLPRALTLDKELFDGCYVFQGYLLEKGVFKAIRTNGFQLRFSHRKLGIIRFMHVVGIVE